MAVQSSEQDVEFLQLAIHSLETADEIVVNLAFTFRNWMNSTLLISQFGRIMTYKINEACRHIRQAAEHLPVDSIIRQLEQRIEVFNQIMTQHSTENPEDLCIHIGLEFHDDIGGPFPVVIEIQAPVPTNEYLKEMSIILTTKDGCESIECPVCFDSTTCQEAIYTNCNHAYCGSCIKKLTSDVTKKPCCPMCRCDLTDLNTGTLTIYNEINDHIRRVL